MEFIKNFNNMTNRFLAFAILLVSSTAISVSVIQYQNYKAVQLERELEVQAFETQAAFLHISNKINYARRELLQLVDMPAIKGLIRASENGGVDPKDNSTTQILENRLEQIFMSLVKTNSKIQNIRFIRVAYEGRKIIGGYIYDDKFRPIQKENLHTEGNSTFARKTFLAPQYSVVMSDLSLNRENGEIQVPPQTVLRIATPVYGPKSNLSGIIVINILMTEVFEAISKRFPKDRQFFVANHNGNYLFHPDVSKVYSSNLKKGSRIQDEFENMKPFLKNVHKPNTSFRTSTNTEQLVYLSKYNLDSTTPDHFFITAAISPLSTLGIDNEKIRNETFLVALIIAIIGAIFAFLSAQLIIRPLRHLTRAASKLERGAHVNVLNWPKEQSGEVGELTRSFIAMANTLDARQTHLEEKERRIAAIMDAAPSTIITIDEQGIIHESNTAASELLGFSKNELIGFNVKMIMDSPHREEHDNYLKAYHYTKKAKIIGKPREVQAKRKDGSMVPVSLSVSEVHLQDKNLYIGILTDLTQQKKIDKLKNEFVSTVSHELRTPLTSIKGSLGLLKSTFVEDLSEKAAAMINIAYNNSDRLIRLINDILDIEKIEAGKIAYDFQRFEVTPFLERVIEANKSYANQYDVNIKMAPISDEIFIEADSDRIAQVTTNLISNAAKFSPKGESITISTNIYENMVRISITDKGPGIPLEFQKKIFGKFAQADSSDTKSQGGTGLGLAISKKIIETHGGKISFETKEGEGTTFFFDLPISEAAPIELPLTSESPAKDILICEDDEDMASLLRLTTESLGYEAEICRNAKEAKKLLSDGQFAAMTLDLSLPGQDGVSLIRELREMPDTAALPILVVSAKAEENEDLLNGNVFNVVDCLKKPVDIKRLRKSLQFAATTNNKKKLRILCIEDDEEHRNKITSLVHKSDVIDIAGSCLEARILLEENDYQLVILDLNLPDGSGEELLPTINSNGDTPPQILVFSTNEVPEELAAQIDGALVKSFTTNEVLRRQIEHLLNPKNEKMKTNQTFMQ